MSIRTSLINNATNSINSAMDSAWNLAGNIIELKGKSLQNQDNGDRLFKSNCDVLQTKYETEISKLYKTLPESIQFDQYSLRVESFNNDFIANAKNSGLYDDRTIAWLEQEYIPSQKTKNDSAIAIAGNFATNIQVADNAMNKANALIADSTLSVDEAYEKYKQYYEELNLGGIENGPNQYGYYTPDEFREILREPKALQEFKRISSDPSTGYTYSANYDKGEAIKKAIAYAGYNPDAAQIKQFEADCEAALDEFEEKRKKDISIAQRDIVSDFTVRGFKGIKYTPDDVISSARDAGAFLSDGSIDPLWVSFLSPYIEASNTQKEIDRATAQINKEIEKATNVTPEQIMTTAEAVSDGSFAFTPDTVHKGNVPTTTSGTSGAKIPLKIDKQYGAPVLNTSDGTEGTGLHISEAVEVTAQGDVVIEKQKIPAQVSESADGTIYVTSNKPIEELNEFLKITPDEDAQAKLDTANKELKKRKSLERNYVAEDVEEDQTPAPTDNTPISTGQQSYLYVVKGEDRPVFDKDYKPYEGTGEETLSDIAVAAQELTKMTEDTGFPNMFNSDGDINYNNSRGKYTYKYNGMPDIETNYAPIVMALCQSCGIEYDTDSYAVYVMAQNVHEMEMAGAFTNPNKALAVQTLATQRLDPNVTPEAYNATVMQYKASGILTDDEIKDYNLEKHAFSGDLSQNSSYNDSLKHAYSKAFNALFDMTYTSGNINNVNADTAKADQWFQMQRDIEKELTLAYQTDPTGMASNPIKTVNEIVEKLTDKTFAENLLDAVLSSGPTLGTWLTSTSNRVQMGDNETVSDMLTDYFQDPSKYADYYDEEIIEAVNDRYYGTASLNYANYEIEKGNAKAQIEELSQDFFGKGYAELSVPEKNKLLFSYAYSRTRTELTRAVCMTFGYDLKNEVYGNISVSSTDGIGGGMAVVTTDGRVYMSGEAPNGGHNWLIGSVSKKTLENIQKGATTISYAEISAYGVKMFNDQNYTFDKSGVSLTRPKTIGDVVNNITLGLVDLRGGQAKKTADKEYELVGIYNEVQPGRYNITDLGKH